MQRDSFCFPYYLFFSFFLNLVDHLLPEVERNLRIRSMLSLMIPVERINLIFVDTAVRPESQKVKIGVLCFHVRSTRVD